MSASVLFLDVDGVLNCRSSLRVGTFRGVYGMICRTKVALLNDVVARSGCLIVVSSAWRSDTRFRPYFRSRGAKVRFHRDWRTGHSPDGMRGKEIADWLSRNGNTRFAIVDDDSDMLPEQQDRFVQTSFDTGLTHAHAARLVAIFERDSRTSPEPQP